ncbi:MAG TPA: hypothetical protein VHU82_03610 [Vicinamibacterales bacterium]|nr:hypothetical protein [Vicinamibacterales bacterium]
MTRRVLALTCLAGILIAGGWLAAAASSTHVHALRSEHAEPAAVAPPARVAVTAEGKLYHRPECTFIHGPVTMMPGEEAVAEGYTPCTRCLKREGR